MIKIDCTGLACPGPVLKAKEIIETQNPKSLVVKVDNPASKENVSRFLVSQGYEVHVESKEDGFYVIGSKGEDKEATQARRETEITGAEKKILVMITSRTIGHGDEKLGISLMTNFIRTLKEMVPNLWKIVLLNEGVKLSTEESPCLPELQELARSGVQILVCGTCLSYYNILDQKRVGETTNMLDVVTALAMADSVININ